MSRISQIFILFLIFTIISLGFKQGVYAQSSNISIVGKPCNFRYSVDEVNLNRDHHGANVSGFKGYAIDLMANGLAANTGPEGAEASQINPYMSCGTDKRAYAAIDGQVITYYNYAGGNSLEIRDLNLGITVRYFHLAGYYVNSGQSVKAGQLIATIGATGNAFGEHIHFEVQKNSVTLLYSQWMFADTSINNTFIPVIGDFDGDEKSDITEIDLNGNWKLDYSSNGFGGWDDLISGFGNGLNNVPLVGDFDGDGSTDIGLRFNDGFLRIDFGAPGQQHNGFNGWEFQKNAYDGITSSAIVGDFNGDGATDFATRDNSGALLNNLKIDFADKISGRNMIFNMYDLTIPQFGNSNTTPLSCDFNDDGLDDLAIKDNTNGYFRIDFASTSEPYKGFNGWDIQVLDYGKTELKPLVGDFNADGQCDIATRDNTNGFMRIDYADNTSMNNGFNGWDIVLPGFGDDNTIPLVGNFDGVNSQTTNKDDFALVDYFNTFKIDSQINNFGSWDIILSNYGGIESHLSIGDYNGDGLDDISLKSDLGNWYIDFAGQTPVSLGGWDSITTGFVANTSVLPFPCDFDGDGVTDKAIKANDTGYMYINTSRDGFNDAWDAIIGGLGDSSFELVNGDFNGDTLDDLAIRINANGYFFIDYANNSQVNNGFNGWEIQSTYNYGNSMYHTISGDFNHDGNTDLAVRNDYDGKIYIDYSRPGSSLGGFTGWEKIIDMNYGKTNTTTFIGNFDMSTYSINGELKYLNDDIAMKDSNSGYLRIDLAYNGYGSWDVQVPNFGGTGSIIFAGDFNGDKSTDVGVHIPASRQILIDYSVKNTPNLGFGNWDKVLTGHDNFVVL